MFNKVIALLEEQAKNLEKKRKEAADKFRCYGTVSGFEPNRDNQLSAISYYTDLIFEIESAVEVLKQVGTYICEEGG